MRFVAVAAMLLFAALACGADAPPEAGGTAAVGDLPQASGTPDGSPVRFPEVTRPEITFQVRLYPKGRRPRNRGAAIRVRLDIGRLRAYGLSSDDVMKAFGESTLLGAPRRVVPPPGVVFVTHLYRPDQYENFILKANAEGEVVRLKEVAKVELFPAY